jgi:hypothetical protein
MRLDREGAKDPHERAAVPRAIAVLASPTWPGSGLVKRQEEWPAVRLEETEKT